MVHSPVEVVFTHNFGFCPAGILREAYVQYLNRIYERNAAGEDIDVSRIKIHEIKNWLRAWTFMEMCGFTRGDDGSSSAKGDSNAE